MAERRMFANSVVMGDKFLDMPAASRSLYFALSMSADDDGFIGAPKRIMRVCGARKSALEELVEAGYVQLFDSGVAVITHWNVNNQIRKDRHRPTVYEKEKQAFQRTVHCEGAFCTQDT